MSSSTGSRYWQFRPFRNPTLKSLKEQLSDSNAIDAYHSHPFDPHAIAWLRCGAYEKAVVMQYIDNLLDWGDMLFRQYTWESITTASLYYLYAWNLLGPRPQTMGACKSVAAATYADIANDYKNQIPEFLIELESLAPGNALSLPTAPYNELDTYFCVPDNADFVAYWDRVEDRLFKIRHCLNIDGQSVPLALFEPPIDPMALARAAAAGADVLSLFGGGGNIDSYYRFRVLLDRARAFTESVMQFGGSLLGALEKKDASTLDRLRSTQEKAILNLSTRNFEQQLEEQTHRIEALTQQKSIAESKKTHYERLITVGMNGSEIATMTLLTASMVPHALSAVFIEIAGFLMPVPNIFGLADGGERIWGPLEAQATELEQYGKLLETSSELAARVGEYQRRAEEWDFAAKEAGELAHQLEKEIAAAEVRLEIVRHELEIHRQAIAQAEEYETFLSNRFTSEDLYQWMIGRVSTVYNQSYHLALDLALKAQAAYQFELSREDTFIAFDYWDSSHKGLLAGEGLMLSLNQMEAAYLQNNVPLNQLEKEMSLLHLDPQKFMEFKMGINGVTQGTLDIELSPALFDSDFPGHYNRKIKSISLTFVGIGLKGASINATLLQTKNTVVVDTEGKVRENWLSGQSVALSRKENDAGLFVLDFRFPDDQFYPFEGTGAVSNWTLTVPPENNRLSFKAISDIVVKLRYTSRDGGKTVADKAINEPGYPVPLAKVFDVKEALGAEKWAAFLSPPSGDQYTLELPLADGVIITNKDDVTLVSATVVLNTTTPASDEESKAFVSLTVGGGDSKTVAVKDSSGTIDLKDTPTADTIKLALNRANLPDSLKSTDGNLKADVLKNIFIAVSFNSKAI